MFDIHRLPTSADSAERAARYEAEQWGARADVVRYSGAYVEGKVRNMGGKACTG